MSNELILLGRKCGTCDGWDQTDTMSFTFYNVTSLNPAAVPSGDWDVDLEKGTIAVRKPGLDEVIFGGDIAELFTLFEKDE